MDCLQQAPGGVKPHVLLVYTQRYVRGRAFESVGNLGILTLAAGLERHGFEARAFTGITTDVMREVEAAGDGLFAVCFYCDFENQSAVAALCRAIRKKYGFLLIIGGPQTLHMTPDAYKTFDVDAILFGDGEESLPKFLAGRLDGKNASHPPEAMLPDSVLPGRFAQLRDFSPYAIPDDRLSHKPLRRDGLLTVISARGCPHRCAFCFEGGDSKTLRARPPGHVLDELEARLSLSKSPRYVFFADDTFTVSAERLEQMLRGLRQLRERYDFVWFCEGHAGFLAGRSETLAQMAEAGMVRMQIGMESAADKILRAYGKGIAARHVMETVRMARDCSLPQLAGNYIIGGAFETPESLRETTAFMLSMMDEAPGMLEISTTFVIPLPGTRLATEPEAFDLIMLDPEFLTSNEDWPPNKTKALSREEICAARRDFLSVAARKMREQFARGLIPSWRIRKDFELAHKYGLVSVWLRHIYSRQPETAAYYETLVRSKGAFLEWDELPEEGRARFWPQRTLSFKHLKPGVLDEGEHDLFRLAGRADLNGIAEVSGRCVQEIMTTARSLAKKRLLLFSSVW